MPSSEFGAEPDFKNAKMIIADIDQAGLGLPDRDYYFRDDREIAWRRGSNTVRTCRENARALMARSPRDDRPERV